MRIAPLSLFVSVVTATLFVSVATATSLRYRCEKVKVAGDICDTYLVAGCVPAAMEKKTYAMALSQDVTRASCQKISEYSCWKLEGKEINPDFCQGPDPGFCKANRVFMGVSCTSDDDCNPYVPKADEAFPSNTCCDVWKTMQPCVTSDVEMDFAISAGRCSNASTCSNPVTPANDGDTVLHKVHCFFTKYLNFFFREPCEK